MTDTIDVAALVEAWKWRAKVNGEWGLWSVVEVDPNDWTWREYWEDLEIVPLVSSTTAEASLATMREALEPFASFAQNNVDDGAWSSGLQRDRIDEWFGPSEFAAAAKAYGGSNAE